VTAPCNAFIFYIANVDKGTGGEEFVFCTACYINADLELGNSHMTKKTKYANF